MPRNFSQLNDDEQKEILYDFVRTYDELSYRDFAKKHDIKEYVAGALATKLRRAGFNLPKKVMVSSITPEMLTECRKIWQEKNGATL